VTDSLSYLWLGEALNAQDQPPGPRSGTRSGCKPLILIQASSAAMCSGKVVVL
jgi:hypothetical protein